MISNGCADSVCKRNKHHVHAAVKIELRVLKSTNARHRHAALKVQPIEYDPRNDGEARYNASFRKGAADAPSHRDFDDTRGGGVTQVWTVG
jgi:hypothetical protein